MPAPLLRAGPLRIVTKVSRQSNVTVIHQSRIPQLLAALPSISEAACQSGAELLQREMEGLLEREGDGMWEPNSPITVLWKGHNRILEGRTGTLKGSVEVRSHSIDHPPLLPSLGSQRLIGFFDEPHPDSDLTVAEIAMVHEFGLPYGENVPGHGTQGSDPMGGMFGQFGIPMDIPERPVVTTVGRKYGRIAQIHMMAVLRGFFASLPPIRLGSTFIDPPIVFTAAGGPRP